ncbi:MAG: beta-L-arabinofuranosidase domain-containing protein [Lachnospiraceae bacterium]
MMIRDFALNEVEVTEPYLQNAFRLEREYLLKLDADRLLAGFYEIAGKQAKAERYPGGWEDADIAGHTMGHYMTALAQAYVQSGQKEFYDKLIYLLTELSGCQAESGYLSAFQEALFDNLEQGKQAWVPWYTMHKILSGLIRVYQLAAIPTALTIAVRLGTWVAERVNRWDEAMKATVLATEYGGMNDCLYELYKETGKIEFMLAAEKFDELPLFQEIHDGKDILAGKHANTTIPKFLGALNRYLVVGEDQNFYLEAAESFFDIVVENHTYVTGGNSEWEHFGEPKLLAGARTNCNCETCNTYNMLKLARGLFQVTGDKKYLDFYEGTYWNAIVSSQNPETGMSMYFQPMATGYFKVFSHPFDNFWCCTGTGMENFTKLNDSIYYKKDDILYIAMYISSTLKDELQGLTLTVEASLPEKPTVNITVRKESEGETRLAFRIPEWNKRPVAVAKNGRMIRASGTEGFLYVTVEKGKTEFQLTFSPTVCIHPLPDNPNVVAFTYGHLVLSAGLGAEDMTTSCTGVNVTVPTKEIKIKDYLEIQSGSVAEWKEHPEMVLTRNGNKLEFMLHGTDEDKRLVFTPHYARYEERYGIYWELIPKVEVNHTVTERIVKEAAIEVVEETSSMGKPQKEDLEGKNLNREKEKKERGSGRGGLVVLVIVLLIATVFCAAMALSESFKDKVVETIRVWTAQTQQNGTSVTENGENTESIPTIQPTASPAPEARKQVDNLAYAVASCDTSALKDFRPLAETINGREYLTFDNGTYRISYKNDYMANTEEPAYEVIVSNGTRTQTFEWPYCMENGRLEELCPDIGDYCKNGREQLVFSFYESKEAVSNYLHIVAGISLEEYYFISPDKTLESLVTLDSFLDAGHALIAKLVSGERTYYVSLPYVNEEQAEENYAMVHDAHLSYVVGEENITMTCYVSLGEGNFVGRIRGKITYSQRDMFQLSSPSFYLFAEDDFCDIDSMGIAVPVAEDKLFTARIPVTGDNGERLLVPVRADMALHEYTMENFVREENGTLAYYENGSKVTLTGIDVSKWQGDINWKKVKAAGVDYAIIRLGYRGTAEAGNCAIDPYYKQNIEGALAAGLQVGVYYFTQAITVEEAIEEANIVIENLQGYDITFPVVFDTEQATDARANKLPNSVRTECAKAFCDTILAAGYTPVIYAGTNWSILNLNMEELQGYDFWYAYYGNELYFPYQFTMWQYTESGRIDGVSGEVDLNISFIDYSTR